MRRLGRELTATLRNLRYPKRGILQAMNSLVHPPLSAQTRVCLGGHQRWLQGEVAPRLCLHLRVRVLRLVSRSCCRPGEGQRVKTRSLAHHLQGTPQLTSCSLLKATVCQDRKKRGLGMGPMATVRPVRQTTCGLETVFNSLAPGLHSPRTASPGLSQLSCVLRVAAPQSCQVLTKRGCVLTDSWRHLLGNAQRWSTGSLPHQLRKPLYGSPGLLRKKVCSKDNKWRPGKQREVRCLLLHRTNR